MKIGQFKISLIIFGIVLISSFIPVVQVILLYGNGGLIALTEEITGIDSTKLMVPFNIIMSLIFLFAYFKSHKLGLQIITAITTVFFLNGLTMFAFGDLFLETEIYWLQFVFGAFIIGISLISIDALRLKYE